MGHSGSKRSRSSNSSTSSRRSLSRHSTMDSIDGSLQASNTSLHKEPSAPSYEDLHSGLAATCDEVDGPMLNTDNLGLRRRFEAANNDNLQNQWKDITGEKSDDLEYAQNLANEDNEASLHEVADSLDEGSIEEQRRILETIQSERESERTEAALNASMQQQLSELSARRDGRDTWRLQQSVNQSGDTVDGGAEVPYNLDWSRMYRLSEWKDALYMTGVAIAIPFIIIGYLIYYLVKGLEMLIRAAQWMRKDTRADSQRARANNPSFSPDYMQNPLMLLILPIMLPILLLKGLTKVSESIHVQRARSAPRPNPTSFRWPQFLFNHRAPRVSAPPIRGPGFRFQGNSPISFNRNRPFKCRCNQCTIM